MFFRIIFTALSWAAPLIIISDNVPKWMVVLAWGYISIMMLLAIIMWKSKQIMAWLDKRIGKRNNKNAR